MRFSKKFSKIYATIISVILALCMAVPLAACNTSNASASIVELDRSTLALDIGEEETLTYTVLPSDAAGGKATWLSSAPTIASVNNGKVTALSEGKASIRVMVSGKSADCIVTVTDPSKVPVLATDISLSKNTMQLEVGGSETLFATIEPANATDKTVIWSSSNPTVAMVGSNGVVSALANGTAVITAKTQNNYQATCVVTVGSGVTQGNGLYVGKISSLQGREADSDHPFIMAMDSSELISVEQARAASESPKFKDFDGNEVEDVLTVLKDNGITDIRIRVWNDPYADEAKEQGYGGGNCDVDNAVALSARCKEAGLGVIIDFHYSDFWADPSKYTVPKAWKGMNISAKETALEKFTKEALEAIKATNVKITMVQVGNETTGGLAGETDWSNICRLMNAGARAIREVTGPVANGGAKIAVHFTDAGRGTYSGYAQTLKNNNVDYDVFGTSWYPYYSSHGTVANLQTELKKAHNISGKEVMVLETAYAFTYDDADGLGNTALEATTQPVTVQGMSNAVRDVIQAIADLGDWGLGVSYWGGTWIAASTSTKWQDNQPLCTEYGCGWATSYAHDYDDSAPNASAGNATSGGTMVDNNAFFLSDGTPLEALKVFKEVFEGHTTDLAADYLQDQEVYYTVDQGPIVLPTTVSIVLNNGSKQTVPAVWAIEPTDLTEYIGKVNMYTVEGTTRYGGTCYCYVWVMNVNLLTEGSFEGFTSYGDNTTRFIQPSIGDWRVKYTKATDELQLFVSNNTGNARMGTNSFHFWDNGVIDFELSQTVDINKLKDYGNGKYGCSFDFQGSDGANIDIYAFIKITYNDGTPERIIKGSAAEMNGWQKWSRTSITGAEIDLSTVSSVTVGIHVYAEVAGQGPWGNIDNAQFYFEG